MIKFLKLSVIVALLCSGQIAQAQGTVLFERRSTSDLNAYTNSPNSTQIQWMTQHFYRMDVFSPYFDNRTSWYKSGLVYQDLYSIPTNSPLVSQHPEWIMHDQYGNWLFVPWDCNGGTCPQYAGDVANPAFRSWWISQASSIVSRGYRGIFVDDVNMDLRVSDGNANPVYPVDSTTGQVMTDEVWRSHIAQFVTQIRSSLPGYELAHNTIWYAGPTGVRDADPYIQQQIQAADVINLERGVASDAGLTGGTYIWSVNALLAYIDRVHALGKAVTLEEYTLNSTQQQYGLAAYFTIANGADRFGDAMSNQNNWWSGYNVNLGAPLGQRTYNNGIFERQFANGVVLFNEPGAATQTVQLGKAYTNLSGASVTSVTLAAQQGAILTSTSSAAAATTSTTVNLSSLTWASEVNGYGPPEKNMSNGGPNAGDGTTISLNGKKFASGLGVHAVSDIHYSLGKTCSNFSSYIGIDDEMSSGLGSVIFQVFGDGVQLYQSGIFTSHQNPGFVSVNISGVNDFEIKVISGVYSIDFDHADWAGATLTCP